MDNSEQPSDDTGPPPWDAEQAAGLLGAYVLVGNTTLRHDGELVSQVQMHGRVTQAIERRGICLALEGRTRRSWARSIPLHPAIIGYAAAAKWLPTQISPAVGPSISPLRLR